MESEAAPGRVGQWCPECLRKWWPWIAAIASGVLMALAYPPWDIGGLIWFALTPLIAALWAGGTRRPFLLGYVAGIVFFTTAFHWLAALGQLFEAPALFGLPLLLGAYLALYPALWAWFCARVLVRPLSSSWQNVVTGVAAASAWTFLEWVRGWMLSGFGWDGVGVALHRDLPMIQIAEITGTLGLTWLVVYVNVMLVIVVRRIVGELGPGFLRRLRWEFTVSIALVVLVFSFGLRRLLQAHPAATKLQIAAVQPNIPQEQKFDRNAEDESQAVLERLTSMAAAMNPDLILWPEASTERGLFSDREHLATMEALRAKVLKPMLVGTVEYTLIDTEPRTFNAAMLLPAGPKPIEEQPPTYRKMHLVPFGEYLPLRPILNPIAGSLVPGDIDPGTDFTVFDTGTPHSFSTLICFEDTLGELARKFVLKGASYLVNITNDGWFLRTAGSEQHLANAVLRAVENRRPLVRCGNSGVTALVNPNGFVERWLEPFREGFAVRTIELRDGPLTFYTRHGDWLGWVSGIVALGAFIRRRRA